MSSTAEIRPFQVDMADEAIADLRRRIAATRLPSTELVADRSQGVQLATIEELARYWAADYDWRACEARLNALPQFTTEIDGVDIHFIHVKSRHADALPLIITHGWPGSVIELLGVVGPLTDPAAHGWVEKVYPSLSYFHEAAKGGHFAAWEEPELFATEIRAAFRPLR
jgi:pimeloyl-ACP methyl ester carboxylesterase